MFNDLIKFISISLGDQVASSEQIPDLILIFSFEGAALEVLMYVQLCVCNLKF